MMVYYVWVGMKVYRLYTDGNTVRYEGKGKGKFIVQPDNKKKLKDNQQAR
jgi:hypothetical protein